VRGLVVLLAACTGCGFEHGQLGSINADASDVSDASDTDVDAVVPVTCPATYAITLASTTTKYRVIETANAFAKLHEACNQDQPGRTHLASPETATEATELRDAIVSLGSSGSQFYIGVVQKPNSGTVTAGWFVFTGPALDGSLWVSTPNDDNPGENNEENLGALNTGDLMHDVTGDLAYPAICECDGLAIDPIVAGYIP
jgi:hypothetical protein